MDISFNFADLGMSDDLYKTIADFTVTLTGRGHARAAKEISAAVRGGATGTEILWSVRYRILRLLALRDDLPTQVVAAGRSIVTAIDELTGIGG